jgi:hypothetical protein
LKYISEIELGGEDVLVKLFILSLPSFLQDWFRGCCEDRGISSFVHLISRFIDFVRPQCQTYEDALQNLTTALENEGFTTEIVEDLRDVYHVQCQEPSDIKEEIYEENRQPLEEEQDFSHDSIECSEDITREVNYEDEAPVTAPQSDEALQDPISPAQDEENEVSHFPFQFFDDTLFYDSESEEEMEPLDKLDPLYLKVEDVEADLPFDEVIQILEAPAQEGLSKVSYFPFQIFNDSLSYDVESEEVLDVLTPSCYDENDDFVDNIDEFIHVGKRKWDVIGYDGDPIYDIEDHFQKFPLQLSYDITKFDDWQQGDDMVTNLFQTPKDDPVLYSPNDFRSYLEDFDDYPSEHLDLFHEEDYQPPLCSDPDRSKDIVFLKKNLCDNVLQPPSITLSCCVIKGVVGKYVFCIKFPLRKTLEFKGRLNTSRRSLSFHPFNLPLRVCQSSSRSLSILSQASDCEDVQGSWLSDLLSQSFEPLTFHDPFLKWIEHFPERMTWHDFVPPTRLHELDFMISDDIVHSLTHVIYVLNLSLFWFMMKHRGRYCETLLGWFHWLFDYT